MDTTPVKKDTIPEVTVKRDVAPDANVKRDVIPEPEVKRDIGSEVKRDNTTPSAQHTKRDPIRLIASFKYVFPRVFVYSPANEVFFSDERLRI